MARRSGPVGAWQIDQDVVVPSGGRYVVDAERAASLDLENLEPPTSLAALMGARLDALTPAERRVVQDGSVLGLTFTRAGLEALHGGVDLDAVLASLCRREILVVDTDPRSSERGQYRFVQALLRGVAHDTLSRRDRHARHLAAAEHLATLPDADALAALVAAHLLDALAALPDDPGAGALRTRAAGLLEQAAQHAQDTGAPTEAARHYATLLGLPPDDSTALRVLAEAGNLTGMLGDPTEALAMAERGLDLARRLGAPQEELLLVRAQAAVDLGRAQALDVVADLWSVLDATEHDPSRAPLAARAARWLVFSVQDGLVPVADAERAALRGLAAVERHGSDEDVDHVLDTLTTWAQLSGYRRLGKFLAAASVQQATTLSRSTGTRLGNAAANLLPDDPRGAAELAGRSRALMGTLGFPDRPSEGHHVLALLLAGQAEAGRAALASAGEVGNSPGWDAYLAFAAGSLAWATGERELQRPPLSEEHRSVLSASWVEGAGAVRAAFEGDLPTAAERAVLGLEHLLGEALSSEDVPLAFELALDLLLSTGGLSTLERLTARLEQVPAGQRYRLLHGQLLRARAHLSDDPAPGLREAAGVLGAMGAAWPAAVVRVELAQALDAAGDVEARDRELGLAEPLLRAMPAPRQLAVVDALRDAAGPQPIVAEPVG